MGQFNTYDSAGPLTGPELILIEQAGITVRTDPDAIRTFLNYTLPIANVSVLGGIKSGADITIDGSGLVSINNNSHTHTWATITARPTTLAGYGITNAATLAQGSLAESALQPTDIDTLAEFNALIADAILVNAPDIFAFAAAQG